MKTSRTLRTVAVLASAAMVLGAFVAGPAEAKKKKKKKPAVCAPFTSSIEGADKPTVVVTDAATEAQPLVQPVTLDMSAGDADLLGAGAPPAAHDHLNIQVDSKAKDAGLYVLFEFPDRRDYDLNLLHQDGSYAARSHGFNLLLGAHAAVDENFGNLSGHGGESTPTSEKLVGIRSTDCGGWTLDVANYLGEGGEMEVKLWLGESKFEPQAPGAETP
jgi:hypothetical protein